MNMLKSEKQKEKGQTNNYFVYVHINKSNRKKYVGITRQIPERRQQKGLGYKYNKNTYFWKAICKYSWDGFDHIILEQGLTHKEANERERYYISLFNSANPYFGYNLTLGGGGFLGMPRSDETKEKIRKSLTGKYCGENSPNYGKRHSQETIAKQIATKLAHHNHHTDEWKKHHGEQVCGINSSCSIPVRCINTGEIFCNAREAADIYCSADKSRIHKCCKGTEKSSGKHPITGEKLRWEYVNKKEN